jgi:phenylalanyl-tRNA synthetase alpha chain
MIGTLKTFFTEFFKKEIDVRITPDYFPFVEPGNGMELSCFLCDMKGCRVCKGTGWLEILGCGMIHPNVLSEAGVDPDVYSGFAWGFGLDRLVMLKYTIEDIRHLRSGDLRFNKQF